MPTDLAANSDFRRKVLELSYSDKEIQRECWIACSRDVVFFVNAFCWILESREAAAWEQRIKLKEIPFVLRDYQQEAVKKIIESLGHEDVLVEKSRETGVSWMIVVIAVWNWVFSGQSHIGFVSKDEDSVDSDDPDTLFAKFEFILKRLPQWMIPRNKRNLNDHTWKNLDNDSTLLGYAATGNVARGGRKLWMLMDEFHSFPAGDDQAALDSTSAVTHSRLIVSTPNRSRGPSGAYYDLITDDTRSGLRLVVDWKDDSSKRRGLYHSERIHDSEAFALVIDDTEFWDEYKNEDGTYRHPTKDGEAYKFVLDGKTRSLYYDDYCLRPGVTSRSVASELDRNFAGAASTVCDLDVINRAIEKVKSPTMTGEIYPDPNHPGEWTFDWSIPEGSVKLWCVLKDGKPPLGEYAAGEDISAGTGGAKSSYSALEIFNKKTGEHVFEWRSNRIDPMKFASLAVWICKWFHDAYMIPEINGPNGALFVKEIIALRYMSVYKRKPSGKRAAVASEYLGYFNTDRGLALLNGMQSAIQAGKAHVNSALALREMSRYLYGPSGEVVHSLIGAEEDASGKGKAHGDAAIALSAAWLGVEDWPVRPAEKEPDVIPYGSFLWRRMEYEKEQRKKSECSFWSPHYGRKPVV